MELKFLLEKYKKLGFSQKRIKELCIEISRGQGLFLMDDNVEVKDGEIKMKISGSKRTHFFLIQEKLKKQLQETFEKEGLKVTKIF